MRDKNWIHLYNPVETKHSRLWKHKNLHGTISWKFSSSPARLCTVVYNAEDKVLIDYSMPRMMAYTMSTVTDVCLLQWLHDSIQEKQIEYWVLVFWLSTTVLRHTSLGCQNLPPIISVNSRRFPTRLILEIRPFVLASVSKFEKLSKKKNFLNFLTKN